MRAKSGLHGAVRLILQNAAADKAKNCFGVLPGVKEIEVIDDKKDLISFRIYPESLGVPLTHKVLKCATDNNFQIESVYTEQGRLDEVFRMITEVGFYPGSCGLFVYGAFRVAAGH